MSMIEHYHQRILIERLLDLGLYKTEDGRQLYELKVPELKERYDQLEKDEKKRSVISHLLENFSQEDLRLFIR